MPERVVRLREFGDTLNDWGRVIQPSEGEESAAVRGADGEASDADGIIRGELDRTQLDLITINKPRHIVSRTPAHIALSPGSRHIVVVQLRGRSLWHPADGHDAVELEPGSVAYWTSALPYRWDFDGPFTFMMLRVPFAALDLAPAVLSPLIGRSFPSDRGFARFVVPFAEQVLADPELLGSQSGTRIVQNLVGLFTTMLVGELDLEATRDRSAPSFLRVVDYLTGHLAEPLDLHRIAEDNGMSTRYLQSLFQERGTSVSEWIRMRRLEAARQALADPAHAAAGVSRIAASHGFADHAHFARTFRATFGETPSQWRARALPAPLTAPSSAGRGSGAVEHAAQGAA